MTFTYTRFPDDIAYGSSGGPFFATHIVTGANGHEQRNSHWQQARARYNIARGIKTQEQLSELISFFRARKGKAEGFLFKDWCDYQLSGEVIATGDGETISFPLVKNYHHNLRYITKPVPGTIQVFVNSELIFADITIDAEKGIIHFASPPPAESMIAVDGEFDVPVRFDTDQLTTTIESYGSYSCLDIPLIEIRS